jgi:predicted RNase H-like nuclease (RuvC/YqgF family)
MTKLIGPCKKCENIYKALETEMERRDTNWELLWKEMKNEIEAKDLVIKNLTRELEAEKNKSEFFANDAEQVRAIVVSMAMEMFGDTMGDRKS